MNGFTIIDGVVALVIIVSAILAYYRGFVRETLSVCGWILAAVLAYLLAPTVEPLVREIPFVRNVLGNSCELTLIVAFAAVFAASLIVTSILSPLFAGAVQRSAVGGVDRGIGFLFGVLRGAVLIAVALVIYQRVVVSEPIPVVDESRSIAVFSEVTDAIDAQASANAMNWLAQQYDQLIEGCRSPGIDA